MFSYGLYLGVIKSFWKTSVIFNNSVNVFVATSGSLCKIVLLILFNAGELLFSLCISFLYLVMFL